MVKHGARVVDEPGSQPPERRRQRRRATVDGAESTGGRRVTPDRRRRADAAKPTPDPGSVPDERSGLEAVAAADAPTVEIEAPRVEVTDDTVTWRRPPAITSFGALSEPEAAAAEAEAEALADVRDPWLPILEDRSPDPAVCPFLRAVAAGSVREHLGPPLEAPDAGNRCAAMAEAVPQSLRQQELVCLTSGHVNCPRYLRGAAGVVEPVRPTTRAASSFSPAILVSVAVLVAAFAASLAFVSARGGLAIEPLASVGPSASVVAQASPTADPTVATSVPASPTPEATPTPTPAPTPSPTPTPAPTPDPTPEPTPTPRPTSDRYQLLEPCPDVADCWIYTIRSGDNLFSIANYFGVSMEAIYARNPWAESTPLRAGQELRLPPPTR